MPIAIKASFFYLLAPLAAKLRPIQILPNDQAPEIPEPRKSSVSIPVDVGANEEILVHSDFLQSRSLPARKHTQWFLNKGIPFSSIASGMFALTRIAPADEDSTRVGVCSQNDALGEVGLIRGSDWRCDGDPTTVSCWGGETSWCTCSDYAALAPRQSARMAHTPTAIPSHSRTVQVEIQRLQGCSGRVPERSCAAHHQSVSDHRLQCEPCLQQYPLRDLCIVSDRKGGIFSMTYSPEGPGRFVYEEMPAARRKGGIEGALKGSLDALLKVFGL